MDLVALQVCLCEICAVHETHDLISRVPYSAVDWVYGTRALEERDGFPNAQGMCLSVRLISLEMTDRVLQH